MFKNSLAYGRFVLVHVKRKQNNIVYQMRKIIILRIANVRKRKTSVRLTCKWRTTRLLLPLERQMYGSFYIDRKTEVRFQRASRVASGNPSRCKIVVTLMTCTPNVRLSYLAFSITSTRFLTLRLATGATTSNARSPNTYDQLWL